MLIKNVEKYSALRDDKWMELNATHQEMRLEPITEGQKVVIVIGENLNEQRIGTFFA